MRPATESRSHGDSYRVLRVAVSPWPVEAR